MAKSHSSISVIGKWWLWAFFLALSFFGVLFIIFGNGASCQPLSSKLMKRVVSIEPTVAAATATVATAAQRNKQTKEIPHSRHRLVGHDASTGLNTGGRCVNGVATPLQTNGSPLQHDNSWQSPASNRHLIEWAPSPSTGFNLQLAARSASFPPSF